MCCSCISKPKKGASVMNKQSSAGVINAVRKQLAKHPNCMNSHSKWDGYKDRPFSSDTLSRLGGWQKTKDALAIKSDRSYKIGLNAAEKAHITRKHIAIDRMSAALKAWVTRRAISKK